MTTKMCVLHERICIECHECLYCDMDPRKLCDNCCACIENMVEADYAGIEIDEIIPPGQDEMKRPTKDPVIKKAASKRYKIRKINKDNRE